MIPPHIREALTERSRGLCEAGLKCCTTIATDPHHKKFKSRGGKDTMENLLACCRNCHDAIHDYRPNTAKFRTFAQQEEGQSEEDFHMGQD